MHPLDAYPVTASRARKRFYEARTTMILAAVHELTPTLGKPPKLVTLVCVLAGRDTSEVRGLNLDRAQCYGVFFGTGAVETSAMIRELLELGLIEELKGRHGGLLLSDEGRRRLEEINVETSNVEQ